TTFFFQDKDCKRDLNVTGVQTCALPICERISILVNNEGDVCMTKAVIVAGARTPFGKFGGVLRPLKAAQLGGAATRAAIEQAGRSEERRGGEEGGWRREGGYWTGEDMSV